MIICVLICSGFCSFLKYASSRSSFPEESRRNSISKSSSTCYVDFLNQGILFTSSQKSVDRC